MRFPMYLYRWHDSDLIYLYKHPQFNFHGAVRACLKNYFEGTPSFWIKLPENIILDNNVPHSCKLQMSLNDDEYATVIDGLKGIQHGFRNSFIKNLLRAYIKSPQMSLFFGVEKENEVVEDKRPNVEFKKTKQNYKKRKIENIDDFIKEQSEIQNLEQIRTKREDEIVKHTKTSEVALESEKKEIFDDATTLETENPHEDEFVENDEVNTPMNDVLESEQTEDPIETSEGDDLFDAFSNMLNQF